MNDLNVLCDKIQFSNDSIAILKKAKNVIYPKNRRALIDLIFGNEETEFVDIVFDVPGKGPLKEGTIARCKNGFAVNFDDVYMRRRDPDAMVIGDEAPTNKKTFKERFKKNFESTKQETFDWLSEQDLLVIPFYSGDKRYNYLSVAFIPKEAAFFALGLSDLQGFIGEEDFYEKSEPHAMIYVAPTFRHTHFGGEQVVVHQRGEKKHEIFAYNLYPGPSAKKGVYSILLNIGEREVPQWSTLHCSTVRVETPYEFELVIMHEGASGGGKTEMTQDPHLDNTGKIRLAHNVDTGDSVVLSMGDTSTLYPITDDMGLVHPTQQTGRKLRVEDAENAWFLRVDHLTKYGSDPNLEALCINPPEPLMFLNIDGKPGATALLWDHIMDTQDKPCPNPRVILPRKYVPNILDGPISIDIRSFGVRAPRCTREEPTYGIFGMMQVLPPALAWLWRLVAPRGDANPSIVSTGRSLVSEGVGSYWPFAIGERVEQANLLLRQIQETPETGYLLIPNQFIGSYHVGFSTQWLTREYVSRRGGLRFRKGQLTASRCALLGYNPVSLNFNGSLIPRGLLRVEEQAEVGVEAYDAGATELIEFFKNELQCYIGEKKLSPLGKAIIDVCLHNGTINEYVSALPFNFGTLGLGTPE